MQEITLEKASVLIVDDQETWLHSISTALRFAGVQHVVTCQDPREVLSILSVQTFDIMLLDLWMPYIEGDKLLIDIKKEYPELPVIVVTATNDVEVAVKCMKLGAANFVVKPLARDQVVAVIERALAVKNLELENAMLRKRFLADSIENPEIFSEIITVNKSMKILFQYIEAVSHTSEPILITGDTGVGKELIAHAIHKASERNGEFVGINISGLDDTSFSDTLFGHRKGAFTGAIENRAGLIESAEDGTLFLDEIGDLKHTSQVKLLRLIQEKEYMPLGADEPKNSNARIVVATHKDIFIMQKSGEFRKDLFYRLRTHHVHVPPLKDRPEDISILLNNFVSEAAKSLNMKTPKIPDELHVLLENYTFPGNIRELRGMVYNAVSTNTTGRLSLSSFKGVMQKDEIRARGPHGFQTKEFKLVKQSGELPTLKEAQDMLIKEALRRTRDNIAEAARILGISRQALSQRLKRKEK